MFSYSLFKIKIYNLYATKDFIILIIVKGNILLYLSLQLSFLITTQLKTTSTKLNFVCYSVIFQYCI